MLGVIAVQYPTNVEHLASAITFQTVVPLITHHAVIGRSTTYLEAAFRVDLSAVLAIACFLFSLPLAFTLVLALAFPHGACVGRVRGLIIRVVNRALGPAVLQRDVGGEV